MQKKKARKQKSKADSNTIPKKISRLTKETKTYPLKKTIRGSRGATW